MANASGICTFNSVSSESSIANTGSVDSASPASSAVARSSPSEKADSPARPVPAGPTARLPPGCWPAMPKTVATWSIRLHTSARLMRWMPFSAASISELTLPSWVLTSAMPAQTVRVMMVEQWPPLLMMRPQTLSSDVRMASRHLAMARALLIGSAPALL